MPFSLEFTSEATAQLQKLEATDPQRLKKVRKTLALLEQNPRHPGLNSHEYHSLPGVEPGRRVWEAYVENKTPAAFRLFYCYGPGREVITVLAITRHP